MADRRVRSSVEPGIALSLEAPSDEETSPGSFHGPHPHYIEIALDAPVWPGLSQALDEWHEATWGAWT